MRLNRLNQDALEARSSPAGNDDNSRRSFLKLLGFSSITCVAGTGGTASAAIPRLKILCSQERIRFQAGSESVWELDTAWFAGRPRLDVQSNEDFVAFALTGARLPGTDIPADMTCSLLREGARWRMQLELGALPYRIEVPFEEWLCGHARDQVAIPAGSFDYRTGDFLLNGLDPAYVWFRPDWKLYVQTAGSLRLQTDGTRLAGHAACISIPHANDVTLLASSSARRTHLCSTPTGAWSVESELPSPEPGRLEWRDGALESFVLETSEHARGRFETALAARGPADGDTLAYLPGDGLRGAAGKAFELGLRDVVYARTYGTGQPETVIRARFATDPVCLYRKNSAITVADSDRDEPGFYAVFSAQVLRDFMCAPALHSVSAAMPGAVSTPMVPTRPALLSFGNGGAVAVTVGDVAQATTNQAPKLKLRKAPAATDSDQTGQKSLKTAPRLKVVPQTGEQAAQPALRPTLKPETKPVTPELKLATDKIRPGDVHLPDLSVPVIRAEDFLSLTFQFVNLRLDPGGAARLVRAEARKPAYIVAVFPPQNIHEEAMFEDSSGATTKPPPVGTRLAGNSRLVFEVPNNLQDLPFTLESLLDACGRFKLKVPRTALPPPAIAELSRFSAASGLKARTLQRQRVAPRLKTRDREERGQAVAGFQLDLGQKLTSLAPSGPEKDKPPGPLETVIEMPYRLWMAPHAGTAWAHARRPIVGHRGRVELWHTRLGVRTRDGGVDEDNDYYRTLRAVWSPDYDQKNMPPHANQPFRASLDARDRHEIVALTSDFRINDYTPLPVWADRMMLTSLGAWLNSRGSWDPPCDQDGQEASPSPSRLELLKIPDRLKSINPCPPGAPANCQGVWLGIEEWRHRATMGRDHYVRVVYKGYLFPFGHRASLIKVTERKFHTVDSGPLKGKIAAYLFQSYFIVVREPVFVYGEDERRNPFRSVRLTTLITPKLDDPPATEIVNGSGQGAFWPTVLGKPFQFHMVATDWRGQASDFTAPLVFLEQEWAKNPDKIGNKDQAGTVIHGYYGAVEDRRERPWSGQTVAFAEVTGANPEAATLETRSITFGADPLPCPEGDQPAFRPGVNEASVRIPAVEALTGGEPARIEIADTYVKNGFGGPNAGGEVFARVLGANPLNFGADRSGGVATPNVNIKGLSRKNGPVGGAADDDDGSDPLADFANGNFDPEKYFAGAATEAMLLGGIRLFELFGTKLKSDQAPKLTNTPIYENDELVAVETALVWEPPVDPRVPVFLKDQGGTTSFRLDARIINRLEGGEPDFIIEGKLTNFAVDLLGGIQTFLVIEFESFEFNSTGGSKTDVTPKIRDVRFEGPLKYVNELSKYTASASGSSEGGASGGMNIEVSPAGVTAGAYVSIPTITSGVMTLQNIAFSAGLTVPFSGDPMRARFAFCDKENPFLMTIYCFGGGGYVGLSVGLDGVEQLELVFEFGAALALDIGVASGSVEVMAGIYISVENDECKLTGYLRMNGELNVLAIIRLSIEFYLGLEYDSASNKAWGECRLTVEIEILFFSASVTMQVRRELSEPTHLPFRDMMTATDWTEYCDAFA